MRIVVTGAAGFLGNNLVRYLMKKNYSVKALIREDEKGLLDVEVERESVDVRKVDTLQRAFAAADVVFHCAAVVSIQGSKGGLVEDVNIGGVKNVVQACLDQKVKKLVHFSSVHALDPSPHNEKITEQRSLCDASPHHPAYARSKANGEREILKGVERGLDACILNPSGMIGPYDFTPSPLGEALIQMYRRSLPALVNGGYNWVDVRDVIASAHAAIETGRPGERYLLTGYSTSVKQLAQAAFAVTGKKPPMFTCPLWLARLSAPLMEVWANMTKSPPLYTRESIQVLGDNDAFEHTKASTELGHKPRPLEETLKDTYDWFAQADML